MITLPFKPAAILHRHGGTITEITSIGHEVSKPQGGHSTDVWFYVGKVRWDGTDAERSTEIEPWALCTDTPAGHAEISQLGELLMTYLRERGHWNDVGPHKGWYATGRSKEAR